MKKLVLPRITWFYVCERQRRKLRKRRNDKQVSSLFLFLDLHVFHLRNYCKHSLNDLPIAIRWEEGTIDNEHLCRKSSKRKWTIGAVCIVSISCFIGSMIFENAVLFYHNLIFAVTKLHTMLQDVVYFTGGKLL